MRSGPASQTVILVVMAVSLSAGAVDVSEMDRGAPPGCAIADAPACGLDDRFQIGPEQTPATHADPFAVAGEPSSFAVACMDRLHSGPDDQQTYFARLDADGNTIGVDLNVSSGPDNNYADPSCVWTGGERGLAWDLSSTQGYRSSVPTLTATQWRRYDESKPNVVPTGRLGDLRPGR